MFCMFYLFYMDKLLTCSFLVMSRIAFAVGSLGVIETFEVFSKPPNLLISQ